MQELHKALVATYERAKRSFFLSTRAPLPLGPNAGGAAASLELPVNDQFLLTLVLLARSR